MNTPPEGENPGPASANRRVRRRLVQSTLFPSKSPEPESPSDPKPENNNAAAEDQLKEENELCGSSQGKKKRRSSGKYSKKQLKEKQLANSTPSKNVTSNGDVTYSPIPNLRLEAKLRAEENSRISAGKQVHPFFSSWKGCKTSHATTQGKNGSCLFPGKDRRTGIGPIHIFEVDQDNDASVDWRNWEFCEKIPSRKHPDLETNFPSTVEASAELPDLNKFPSVLRESSIPVAQDNASLDGALILQQRLCEASAAVSAMSCDEQDCEIVEVGPFPSCVRLEAEQQSGLVKESTMTYNCDCASQVENKLWTDKYQPKKAMEVCGNYESVKILSEWLLTWRQKGHQACNESSAADADDLRDADYQCLHSDSDSENINEVPRLKNVLLITGPIGSGKSAAIYACAEEQGFKILEANTADCRNGAVVKQRFGAALQSRTLDWLDTAIGSPSTPLEKFSKAPLNNRMAQESESEVIEVIPILDEDNFLGANEYSRKPDIKNISITSIRGQIKPLILFEDVDIIFGEDRGFISAIQQIAGKAKGPVILTSNSDSLILPNNLDRLEVRFTLPSEKELLQYLHKVCSAEELKIQQCLVEPLLKLCHGDIRKTIMYLQFWCQGKQSSEGAKIKGLFNELKCDPVPVHELLPRMLSWDMPSQLSQVIEKEITISSSLMEGNSNIIKDMDEESDGIKLQNNLESKIYETSSIEAKKEEMLSRNCPDHDCNNFMALEDVCDFFISPDPPVSLSGKNSRRKLRVVMSSDSEDENHNHRGHFDLNEDIADGLSCQIMGQVSGDMQPSSEAQVVKGNHYKSPETQFDLNVKHSSMSIDVSCVPESVIAPELDLNVNDTCMSIDMSCVPESSFVPETQINNGREELHGNTFCGDLTDAVEEASVSNECKENLSPITADTEWGSKLDKDAGLCRSTCNVSAESSHKEAEDSHEHLEAVARSCQLMDECSRMGPNCKPKHTQKPRSFSNPVQDVWRKLRECRGDLRQILTLEPKDAVRTTNLAYCMSDLVSEAELLFSSHHPRDFTESSQELETSNACSWYGEQLHMTSDILQHGFNVHTQGAAALGYNLGLESCGDLAGKTSTLNMMELGNLHTNNTGTGPPKLDADVKLPETETSSDSETKSRLSDVVQLVVPPRLYLTTRGDAFHEYLSCLAKISRLGTSSTSEVNSRTRRRSGRAPLHYLSTGALMLSPEDILLLSRSNSYGKISSESTGQLSDSSL